MTSRNGLTKSSISLTEAEAHILLAGLFVLAGGGPDCDERVRQELVKRLNRALVRIEGKEKERSSRLVATLTRERTREAPESSWSRFGQGSARSR